MQQHFFFVKISFQFKRKVVKCAKCGHITRADKLALHQSRNNCKIRCDQCCKLVQSASLDEHKKTHEMNLDFGFSQSSSLDAPIGCDSDIEEEFQDIYKNFRKYIKTKTKLGSIMDRYNFQSSIFSTSELVFLFKKLFRSQRNAFKINISMGFILQHKSTGKYRYFWASQNNQLLLDRPCLIRNSIDKTNFIKQIGGLDLAERVSRPTSEWIFVKVTNVEFFVYKLKGVPIGSALELPEYLMRNKGLNALIRNHHNKQYADKKCFFRCLALFQGISIRGLERKTNKLLKFYCEKAGIKHFDGVTLDQLDSISRLFKIPINVYEQDENRSTNLIFRSTLCTGTVLNLNLWDEHFSFIKDLEIYSQSFRCKKCDKMWKKSGNFHRHIKTCEVGVKEYYKSGTFTLKPTIFDELETTGIIIPQSLRTFPFRATYDIECMLQNTEKTSTEKTEYTAEHVLASISVCSNVPGYEKPKCFILSKDGEQNKLVQNFLDYLLEISDRSAMLMRERFGDYMDIICSSPLAGRFEQYVNQMPVLSFNGAKYDLKILKTHLIPLLVKSESMKFVIKKGTGYMVITTEELKFLDIIHYIAPGFSYDMFLKAYGAEQFKTYFPYEYFDSLEKLDSKVFPSYDHFFSSLKGRNTLEPVVGSYEVLAVTERDLIGRNPTKKNPISLEESLRIGNHR